MDYLLAHDVGTSGAKAALVTTDGRVAATAFEPYVTRYPRPLWAEQDPQDWWRAVVATTRRLIESSGAEPHEILGLAFSTQMVNALPVDAQCQPLMPCISWLDARDGKRGFELVHGFALPGMISNARPQCLRLVDEPR